MAHSDASNLKGRFEAETDACASLAGLEINLLDRTILDRTS